METPPCCGRQPIFGSFQLADADTPSRRCPGAFTLIELLAVICVIGLLAALIFPLVRAVNRIKLTSRARAELAQLECFIDSYRARIGSYPPDNHNARNNQLLAGLNQLYYELVGTTYKGDTFITKDFSSPPLTPNMVVTIFGPGVAGFVNCDKGDTDDFQPAIQFLNNIKPSQVATISMTNGGTRMSVSGRVLVCTVPGPDPNEPPLNNGSPPLNPWRYNSSSPTNNPNTYDLWVDIAANGHVFRICNWTSKARVIR
jgi:type II secretory pathway pseudopilin PulG